MPATVIHCRYAAGVPADQYVYCGRPSKWGNPHHVGRCPCGKVHAHGEAILLFAQFWNSDDGAMLRVQALQELPDKVLGCWCHPRPCHVDLIADYVNQYAHPH
jgi:hypothetical protein